MHGCKLLARKKTKLTSNLEVYSPWEVDSEENISISYMIVGCQNIRNEKNICEVNMGKMTLDANVIWRQVQKGTEFFLTTKTNSTS